MIFPNDANGDVFRRLQSSDFDFTAEYVVDFYSVLATEEGADSVAKMFLADHKAGRKLANIETKPHDEGGMCLELSRKMVVSYEAIVEFESLLSQRVDQFGGYLDGWGVMHEPKNKANKSEQATPRKPSD